MIQRIQVTTIFFISLNVVLNSLNQTISSDTNDTKNYTIYRLTSLIDQHSYKGLKDISANNHIINATFKSSM